MRSIGLGAVDVAGGVEASAAGAADTAFCFRALAFAFAVGAAFLARVVVEVSAIAETTFLFLRSTFGGSPVGQSPQPLTATIHTTTVTDCAMQRIVLGRFNIFKVSVRRV